MIPKLPYKTKQFFFVLVKLSIVVGAFYFIYQKTLKNPNLDFIAFQEILIKNNLFSFKNSCFLLLLSVFNWYFEILKWKTLVSPIEKISLNKASEQSLGSLTASLMTPNRIGEYGAKAMYYKKSDRKHIVLINLLSNMLQMAVTCLFGAVGLSFFALNYPSALQPFKPIITTMSIVIIMCFILYILLKRTIMIRGFSIQKIVYFLVDFPKNKISLGFLLSCFRYLLFSFQFYCILSLFHTNITYINAMMVIASIYFLSSVIPSIVVFDVIVKGSVALYLFTFLDINEIVVLSIIMIMWLLNVVLPSMFGSLYVLNFKLPKETN